MSLKSDRWIRRMVAAQKMIEPFESGQIRHVDGKKSYPTEHQAMVMMYGVPMNLRFLPILILLGLIPSSLTQRVLWM